MSKEKEAKRFFEELKKQEEYITELFDKLEWCVFGMYVFGLFMGIVFMYMVLK